MRRTAAKSFSVRYIFLSIVIFLYSMSAFGQSVNVPLDYWGYSYLERLEAKGLVTSNELRVKPLSRAAFAHLVKTVADDAAGQLFNLTDAEWLLLDQLKGDFIDELANHIDISKIAPEKHMLTWSEDRSGLYFDAHVKQSFIANRGGQTRSTLSETVMGGIVRGHLDRTLGFYVNTYNTATRGTGLERDKDLNFDVSKGLPVNITGENVFQDNALAYFILEKNRLRFELGKDRLTWGPGYHGGLSLSKNTPPFDLIRFNIALSPIKFTYIHAFLSSSFGAKYLAAHRIDFTPIKNVHIGISETVVYGNRKVDAVYLNPILPFRLFRGSRDNHNFNLDVTTTILPSTVIYGEIFVDEISINAGSKRRVFDKWACLVGGLWTEPLRIPDLSLRAEFAHVEPGVYTRGDSIHIYSHYDKIMGYWLGPDSDSFFLQGTYQFGRDWQLQIVFEHIRKKSETVARTERNKKNQLSEDFTERRNLMSLKLIRQVCKDVFAAFSLRYMHISPFDRAVRPDSIEKLATFEVYVNY